MKNDLIKITVILTCYNAQDYILETVNSILRQRGQEEQFQTELIIVDDCSTDGTQDLLVQKEILFYKTQINSGGPNVGRNIGIKKATGSWLIISDHDDIWHPNRIISLLPFLDKASIISSGFLISYERKSKVTRREVTTKKGNKYYPKNETFNKHISKDKSKQNNYLGSLCFKNISVPTFEEVYNQVDFDWLSRLFYNRDSYYLDMALYTRRQHNNNLSRNEQYRINDSIVSLDYLKSMEKKFPHLTAKGKKGIYGTLARYYYSENKMKESRKYILKAGFSIIHILYYCTSFIGNSFVNKTFKVFD